MNSNIRHTPKKNFSKRNRHRKKSNQNHLRMIKETFRAATS